MKVVVIDDDKVFVEPLLWRLQDEGHEVVHIRSVNHALTVFSSAIKRIPDCILLDIMMPRGNAYSEVETNGGRETGLRLLADIWRKERNRKIPVIITTVRQDLNIAELQKEFGESIKGVVVKPTTPTEIINRLKELFSE